MKTLILAPDHGYRDQPKIQWVNYQEMSHMTLTDHSAFLSLSGLNIYQILIYTCYIGDHLKEIYPLVKEHTNVRYIAGVSGQVSGEESWFVKFLVCRCPIAMNIRKNHINHQCLSTKIKSIKIKR